MRTRVAIAVAALLVAGAVPATAGSAAAAQEDCSFPVSMVDATGTEVTVEAEPQRVVTLAPSAAQTMWEIGAKGKVVGTTKYAAYLEGAGGKANVSGADEMVVIETVVGLEPDLVIAPNVIPNDTVAKLRDAGVTVYRFEAAKTIEDIYTKTRRIGRLVGECEGAEGTVAWMQDRIGTVREAVEGEKRPDVLYLFFGYTAGKGTFINEVIQVAGGNNIAADRNITSYQQISAEVVVEENPDWIIVNDKDPSVPKTDAYNSTTAVQEGQVVVVQIEHINQPAPRVVHAITKLAKAFHPEAYAAANATPTPTPTESPTPSPTPTPTPAADADESTPAPTESPTPTEAPAAPGFGIVAATIALLLAVLGARARQ